ncbi:MAG: helix-turn-helix domain-containing protein [Actinobacteria bacterium]|nr:helix-turn-helix domain-containing protein [Actinomycetota bacterium]
MSTDNLRDGRVKNWFYLENELLDRQDLSIYEKMIYIVIARFVDREDKAFPSVPTIAKKGSMSERQVQAIINCLVKKGLLKKESRINKENKSKTSNLYTLLSIKRNQSGNDKDGGVVNKMHHPGEHGAPPPVNDIHPNNTNIKNTSLNNVNREGREQVVENYGEGLKEITTEDKEDINDIKRKIKQSLGENNSLKESIKSVVNKYPEFKRYKLKENELLAKEIAESLRDDHSLGAFRAVVDKIPEQKIRIFLSIIKDTYLTGRIKKSRGAMFISLAKDYARENNINLNFISGINFKQKGQI